MSADHSLRWVAIAHSMAARASGSRRCSRVRASLEVRSSLLATRLTSATWEACRSRIARRSEAASRRSAAYTRTGPPGGPIEVPPRAAVLLGVAGTIVVCHGSATGEDVAAGIALAAHLHRRAALAAIAEMIPHNEVSHE